MCKPVTFLFFLLAIPDFSFAQNRNIRNKDSCLIQLQITKNDTNRVNLMLTIGWILRLDSPETSLKYYEKALNLSEKIQWQKGIGRSYMWMGWEYENAGLDPAKAIEYCQESIPLSEEVKDKESMAWAMDAIGLAYYDIGNYPESLKWRYNALNIFEEIPTNDRMPWVLMGIGSIFEEERKYDQAEEYYNKARKLYENAGNKKGEGRILYCFGSLSLKQEQKDKALDYYSRAVNIFKETNDEYMWSWVTILIGKIYYSLKDYPKAESCFIEALNKAEESQYPSVRANIFDQISNVYYEAGYDTINSRDKIFFETDPNSNLLKSIYYANAANSEYRTMGTPWANPLTYQRISAIDEKWGKYKESLDNYKLYSWANDTTLSMSNKDKVALIEKQREIDQKQKELEIQHLGLEASQKQRWYLIGIIFLLLTFSTVLYNRYQLKKRNNEQALRLAVMEKQFAVEKERQRISRDMHDELGSGISMISMMSDLVKHEPLSPLAKDKVEKISSTSNELVQQMREIVWTLNPQNDPLKNLLVYLRQYAFNFFAGTTIECKISMPHQIPDYSVSGEWRRSLFLVVKESLNNILRHSNAKHAVIAMDIDDQQLQIIISDDGTGINSLEAAGFGNGLKNMRKRMEDINGSFGVESSKGTRIKLSIPLNSNTNS